MERSVCRTRMNHVGASACFRLILASLLAFAGAPRDATAATGTGRRSDAADYNVTAGSMLVAAVRPQWMSAEPAESVRRILGKSTGL